MPPPIIPEAYKQVVDLAVARLAGKTGAGEPLDGIQSVVRGESGKLQDVRDKTLWVHGTGWNRDREASTIIQSSFETRLIMTAIVNNRGKPEEGASQSQWFANMCVYQIMHDADGEYETSFGTDWIDDITEEQGTMATGPSNGGLSGSATQVIVKFRATRV